MAETQVRAEQNGRRSSIDPRVALAFLAIYFLWGTTFLAIRVAVREIPPMFAAGVRMLIAGVVLLGFMRLRGAARLTAAEWRSTAMMGVLMFSVNYAALFWAEESLPSGIAAVVVATVPLMMIVFEIFIFRLQPFRWVAMAAVLLGFMGVGVLLLPDSHLAVRVLPCLAILVGSAAWCLGTVWSRKLPLPQSKPVTAGASMTIGGAVLLLFSAACGELSPWPHVSRTSVLALAYLITFGSLVAYTAYVWLLARMPVSTVSSYAYVNPVVAVVLGYFVADEAITPRMAAGAALILLSVFMSLRMGRRPAKA